MMNAMLSSIGAVGMGVFMRELKDGFQQMGLLKGSKGVFTAQKPVSMGQRYPIWRLQTNVSVLK
jgi:hypothetical protein